MKTFGLLNEAKIAAVIDDKSYLQLSQCWKANIEQLYGAEPLRLFNRFKKIKCYRKDDYTKPDLVIEYLNKVHYISVKTGTSMTLHNEKLETFLKFLSQCGISEKTINTIKFVHYGDGTLDGSGKVRLDFFEIFEKHRALIVQANIELNSNVNFTLKVFDRVMFQGVDPNAIPADYIYNGDETYGRMVSRIDIEKWVKKNYNKFNYLENLHIGPLILKPRARYAHTKVQNEKFRNDLKVNFEHLSVTLDKIYKTFGM